jgi:hypothetical protein
MRTDHHILAVQFATAVVGSFGLWWLIPQFFGTDEPWDAGSLRYRVGLSIVTGVSVAIRVRSFWLAMLGVYLGQAMLVGIMEPEWFVLGLFSLVWHGVLPMLVGALIGTLIGLPFAFIPIDDQPPTEESST